MEWPQLRVPPLCFPLFRFLSVIAALGCGALHAADNPFLGRWALTIPGGGAGWLGVEAKDGGLTSSVLWGGGSVVPTTSTKVDGDTLVVTRVSTDKDKNETTETITAKVQGDRLMLSTRKVKIAAADAGKPRIRREAVRQAEFTGKRIAALPPRA